MLQASGNGMVLMSLNPQTARHEWIKFVYDAVELAINCKNEERFSKALPVYTTGIKIVQVLQKAEGPKIHS